MCLSAPPVNTPQSKRTRYGAILVSPVAKNSPPCTRPQQRGPLSRRTPYATWQLSPALQPLCPRALRPVLGNQGSQPPNEKPAHLWQLNPALQPPEPTGPCNNKRSPPPSEKPARHNWRRSPLATTRGFMHNSEDPAQPETDRSLKRGKRTYEN